MPGASADSSPARQTWRLRARQLGQTVVSSSRRLSRLDKEPCSVCRASAETSGCVLGASYGCETKLPLARLSAPYAAARPEADCRTRAVLRAQRGFDQRRKGRARRRARQNHVISPEPKASAAGGSMRGAGCPQTAGRASRSAQASKTNRILRSVQRFRIAPLFRIAPMSGRHGTPIYGIICRFLNQGKKKTTWQ